MPLSSMYSASAISTMAKARLSLLTGSACAARAPSGAISTLQQAITMSAGNHR